jgi:hypothetical protein
MLYGMLSIWLAGLLLATTADAVEPPPRGRFCIGDAKTSLTDAACVDTSSATIAVKPVERERRFFWLSTDAKTAYAGVIAPKGESVVLDPKSFSALDTTIDGDATRGWPHEVTVTVTSGPEQQWMWKLDRDEAKRLRRLYVPRGKYLVMARTERHRTFHTNLSATADPVKLELRFAPWPVARGIVVDVKDQTIAGAAIALQDGTPCATADERGEFTCELPERIPQALIVSGTGYAAREARIIDPTPRDVVDLGRIQLSAGRRLTVTVVRSEPIPVRVSLFLDVPRHEHSKVKTISLAKEEETARFDTGEGKHFVVVEGDGPLERLAVPVTVKDVDVEEEIRVEPFQLSGSVYFGDKPLKEGRIEVTALSDAWRVALPITDGAFTATMWQKGVVSAWVQPTELGLSEHFTSPELGANPSKWDIRIEKRLIAGRVFDAATKAPLPYAGLEVSTETENSGSFHSTSVRADGSYEVLAHNPGKYVLKVESPHHVAYSVEFQVTKDDRSRTHDIAMEAGVVQPIDVVMPGGVPAYVKVFEGVHPDRVDQQFRRRVDERGRYEVRGLPGTSLLVYFVPAQGSLAIERVQLPRTNVDVKPLQVVIPPPCCALRILGRTPEGTPMSPNLLIRYSGEFLPPAIESQVTLPKRADRPGEVLLQGLPAGNYEIWATASDEEREKLLSSGGSFREPVRVGLSSGEQAVTVVVGHGERDGRE